MWKAVFVFVCLTLLQCAHSEERCDPKTADLDCPKHQCCRLLVDPDTGNWPTPLAHKRNYTCQNLPRLDEPCHFEYQSHYPIHCPCRQGYICRPTADRKNRHRFRGTFLTRLHPKLGKCKPYIG